MKTDIASKHFAILGVLMLCVPGVVDAATNDLGTILSKGLFEEEANHNLGAAIQVYQSVIERFDTDRKITATAVFRLGECYRKQGSTNDAKLQYERVLREFADQTPLVTLSRQYLAALGIPPSAQAASENPPPESGVGKSITVEDLGETSRVEAIIRNSPDLINAPDQSGITLLQTYAGQGNLAVVKLLLNNGAAVNGIKQPDLTPLHFAAGNGHKAVVDLLLSKGAKPDVKTEGGVTPLHLAVYKGYELVAKDLLEAGAPVNAKIIHDTTRSAQSLTYGFRNGQTPLHQACLKGYRGLVDLLIQKGADVNAEDGEGATPLTIAATANNDDMVKTLLAAHADPNVGRSSALVAVAAGGNVPLLHLFLSNGANPNSGQPSPLEMAVRNKHPDAVKELAQFKADPNAKDNRGWPLIFAALVDTNSLEALLENGADPNLTGPKDQNAPQGVSPMERALQYADPSGQMEILLAHGADPNGVGDLGFVHLSNAARWDKTEAAELLLNHGAKVNVQDKNGNTPLYEAVTRCNSKLVEDLLVKGADPNLANNTGIKPLGLTKWIARYLSSIPGSPGLNQALPLPGGSTVWLGPLENRERRTEIAQLLLKHGAIEEFDTIKVRRLPDFEFTVFSRSTNDLNHFTLLELLAVHYGFVSAAAQPYKSSSEAQPFNMMSGSASYDATSATLVGSLAFPNLGNIEILRSKQPGNQSTNIAISAESILETGDCSRDVLLNWGDQVEIPEADHPVSAKWSGLSAQIITNLQKCLKRQVSITVKGQTTNIVLQAPQPGPELMIPGQFPGRPATFRFTPPQFCLLPVLQSCGLLHISSDLSRVKVTRHHPPTGENWEKTIDCSSTPTPNLWLRDGDVIEVPDKM